MLGQALSRTFADQELRLMSRDQLDITNQEAVAEYILSVAPQLILNAAAYTNVNGAESQEALATKVNGGAVGFIASSAKQVGATLVHFSTDYVFDGTRAEGYYEDDPPSPINAYGRSKLVGEQALQASGCAFYLIRTSWLYGPGGTNFVDTILTKARQEGRLKIVNDQFGRPTFTQDLAARVRQMIDHSAQPGLYHIANATPARGISWYDFASVAVKLAGIQAQVAPCATAEFPTPAKRPVHSVLHSTKAQPLRDWESALTSYIQNQ
jgi:dTDP-4-dehydrorhamnose reductase